MGAGWSFKTIVHSHVTQFNPTKGTAESYREYYGGSSGDSPHGSGGDGDGHHWGQFRGGDRHHPEQFRGGDGHP